MFYCDAKQSDILRRSSHFSCYLLSLHCNHFCIIQSFIWLSRVSFIPNLLWVFLLHKLQYIFFPIKTCIVNKNFAFRFCLGQKWRGSGRPFVKVKDRNFCVPGKLFLSRQNFFFCIQDICGSKNEEVVDQIFCVISKISLPTCKLKCYSRIVYSVCKWLKYSEISESFVMFNVSVVILIESL